MTGAWRGSGQPQSYGGRHDHGDAEQVRDRHPVERTSRKLVLIHLNRDRTAAAVSTALISVFSALPPPMRRSLTWDQGKEMACHRDLTRAVRMPVYFCQKSSPWQRGSNENMNGLLRDYFRKAPTSGPHNADRLAEVDRTQRPAPQEPRQDHADGPLEAPRRRTADGIDPSGSRPDNADERTYAGSHGCSCTRVVCCRG